MTDADALLAQIRTLHAALCSDWRLPRAGIVDRLDHYDRLVSRWCRMTGHGHPYANSEIARQFVIVAAERLDRVRQIVADAVRARSDDSLSPAGRAPLRMEQP